MDEADLTNIERIVRQGYDLSPTMVRQVVAEVRRLRSRRSPDQEAAHLEYAQLEAEVARCADRLDVLRKTLWELYEATHGYLNLSTDPRRLGAPADRLQDALVAAYALLHGDDES